MKHIIIGTAGHIDHGKTALIKALTGRDTDRLKEEKKRGITIDLGFTWFDLRDGTRCGIIDVPGHEKFIANMAAGVCGMDLVLMVIAADEGVMPQTREHLDIIELFGVRKAIIVFSKCDLQDEEWIDIVEKETREELKGTILENAPAVRVSSVTGEGLDELRSLIYEMADGGLQKEIHSIPRLPVDRVFTVPGSGTVVTGTLLSGSIAAGDNLCIYPDGIPCRVRSIQVHEKDTGICEAGQRTALNLPGIAKEAIRRGCVIAPEGSMKAAVIIDAVLRVLPDSKRVIRNRERLHLFIGTARLVCRAYLMDRDELKPGESGFAQLVCEEKTAVRRGDRFVVRFYSPMETIGGGVVLDTGDARKKRLDPGVIREFERKQSGSLSDLCELKIKSGTEDPVALTDLASDTGRTREELSPYLEDLKASGAVLIFPLRKETWLWHADNEMIAEQRISRALRAFYVSHPFRKGVPKAEIHSSCMKHVKLNVFDACLAYMAERGKIRILDGLVCGPRDEYKEDIHFVKAADLLMKNLEAAGYQFVHFREMDQGSIGEENAKDVLRLLVDEGSVVCLDGDIYTTRKLADEAEKKIRAHFEKNEILTVIDIKEMLGVSRKNAKLMFDYTDRIRLTAKTGGETERTPGPALKENGIAGKIKLY